MCEFLASHGYLVIAFAAKGRFSSGLEVSTVGLETAVADLQFVLGRIATMPNANLHRLFLIGNAISSSICAAAAVRNPLVKGVISLEGGLPSAFEQRLLRGSTFYHAQNLQVPILFIYAPHPSIDPKHTYHLIHADKYYAHFPKMSEFAMLNFGMFDALIPNIIGVPKEPTQEGFEKANELVLRFLEINTKNSNTQLFEETYVLLSKPVIDTTFVLEAIPAAPNIADLKDLFLRKGMKAVDSTYLLLQSQGNPQPFSLSFIESLRDWLAGKKTRSISLG